MPDSQRNPWAKGKPYTDNNPAAATPPTRPADVTAAQSSGATEEAQRQAIPPADPAAEAPTTPPEDQGSEAPPETPDETEGAPDRPWEAFTQHAQFATYVADNSVTTPDGWDGFTVQAKKDWLTTNAT